MKFAKTRALSAGLAAATDRQVTLNKVRDFAHSKISGTLH